jgi:hypothetical protein
MKSDHRHELKSNELAHWISEFPEWAKANSRMIIAVGAIVVAVALVYGWILYDRNVLGVNRRVKLSELSSQLYANKRQAARSAAEGKDASLLLLEAGNRLVQFAESTGDPTMASLAYLKHAEALRSELHYRATAVLPEDIAKQIEKAKASYQKALDKAGTQVSLKAAAQYGLGLCAEELSDQAQARQIYQQIVSDAGLKGTVAQAAARHRLDTMADYAGSVAFRPGPEPIPAPAGVLPGPNLPSAEANQPATAPAQVVAPPAPAAGPNVPGANSVAQ